jgi:molecular chaperone GrpE (heat shock protein)
MSKEKPIDAAQGGPLDPGTDADPAGAAAPTVESLQAEVAQWKAKADEYLEHARRAKADFINFQDRVRRDKADWNRLALESFVRDLLPTLDGFSMAKFEDPKLLEAVRLLEKEILRVLAKTGVTPIETAGKTFDPLFHDAVAMEPGGTQLEEVRRGWLFDGKVLRASSVRLVKPKE